jgi:hypothetical protein
MVGGAVSSKFGFFGIALLHFFQLAQFVIEPDPSILLINWDVDQQTDANQKHGKKHSHVPPP